MNFAVLTMKLFWQKLNFILLSHLIQPIQYQQPLKQNLSAATVLESNSASLDHLQLAPNERLAGNRFYSYLLIIVISLIVISFLRIINLDADPTTWFIDELGYQIDEGYKTLSPRNLAIFGQTHWNQYDEYRGWMLESALTQWPYYWAFQTLGIELSSARLVSIVYATLMLVLAALFLRKRHSWKIATIGVLLLASDPGLFLFSRSALFETALALFTYAALFVVAGLPNRFHLIRPILMLGLTVPTFYFLKKSALVYTGPPLLAVSLLAVHSTLSAKIGEKGYVLGAVLIVGGVAGFLYYQPWILLGLDLRSILAQPQKIFLNPTHTLSPLALIIGYGILLELLVRCPRAILEDGYRFSLAAILLLSPILISLFTYNYSRYYIPIVPAAFLLVTERLALKFPTTVEREFSWLSLHGALAVMALLALAMTVLATINYYIFSHLPITIGDDPGLSNVGLLKVYPLFLLIFVVCLYWLVRRYGMRLNKTVLTTLASLHIVLGLGISITAIASPSYQSLAIQEKIIEHATPDAIIGGDWAPWFARDSNLRALYMRPDFNSATIVTRLRPDYFLYSDTPYDKKNLKLLEANSEIALDTPIELSTYAGHRIVLYPIHYLEHAGNGPINR